MVATLSPRAQDSTAFVPVPLPTLSARGWDQLVALLEGQHPDETARLRRGLEALRTKRILEGTDTGVYLVESSIPDQYYKANTARCTCPDALAERAPRCKHVWAITLLVAASVAARYERLSQPDPADQPIPYEITPRGHQYLAALDATPARAS